MKIDQLIKEKFVVMIELHPLQHKNPEKKRWSIIDKAFYLRPYADIVTVTESTSGQYSHSTLETVQLLKEYSAFQVVPHLTLRLYTPRNVKRLLRECHASDIRSLFVVRGDDYEHEEGSYRYSSEMIQHIRELNHELSVGAACNPHAPKEQELRSIKAKAEAGATYLISQPVFSVEEYQKYVAWLRENGITLPVIPGIMPLKSAKTIEFINKNIKEIKIPEEVKEMHINSANIEAVCIAFNRQLIRALCKAGAPGVDVFSRGDVRLTEQILVDIEEESAESALEEDARVAPLWEV